MNPRLLTRRPTLLSLGVTSAAAFALASKERRPLEESRTAAHPDHDNISEKARAMFAEGGWNASDPTYYEDHDRPKGVELVLFRNGYVTILPGTFGLFPRRDFQVIAWK